MFDLGSLYSNGIYIVSPDVSTRESERVMRLTSDEAYEKWAERARRLIEQHRLDTVSISYDHETRVYQISAGAARVIHTHVQELSGDELMELANVATTGYHAPDTHNVIKAFHLNLSLYNAVAIMRHMGAVGLAIIIADHVKAPRRKSATS